MGKTRPLLSLLEYFFQPQKFGGASARCNRMQDQSLMQLTQKGRSLQEARELLEGLRREFHRISPLMQTLVLATIEEASVSAQQGEEHGDNR